jgi:hypothetical protein
MVGQLHEDVDHVNADGQSVEGCKLVHHFVAETCKPMMRHSKLPIKVKVRER